MFKNGSIYLHACVYVCEKKEDKREREETEEIAFINLLGCP